MSKLTENGEASHIGDPDYMCLTHGQTVPLAPLSCEYEGGPDPCRYAWVDLTPIDEVGGFMAAKWASSQGVEP